jgi:hypothetical protein
MKKSIIILIALLLLCACQPTPESPIVVGKDQNAMIEQAKREIPEEQRTMSVRERLGVPEKLAYSYHKGNLTIEADAEIVVPDGELPIVRAFPTDFDQETVTDLWNALIGDIPMTAIVYKRAKPEIEQTIEKLLAAIDGGKYADYGFASEEKAKDALKALQIMYREAPDDVAGDPADSTLRKGVFLDDDGKEVASHTYLYAESQKTGYRFSVSNNASNTVPIVTVSYDEMGRPVGTAVREVDRRAGFTFIKNNEPQAPCFIWGDELSFSDPCPTGIPGTVTVTPQRAKEYAETFLKDAKLDGAYAVRRVFVITDSDATEFAYRIVCTHTVGGCPALMTGNTGEAENAEAYFNDDENDDYAEIWEYEQFWIDVNDSGVYCVQMQQPLAIGDVVTERSNLLSFSEIRKIMEKMLPIVYDTEANDPNSENSDMRYTKRINRVELGLWRVREQNRIDRGLLIPVWAFYASTTESYPEIGYSWQTYLPILLVNAIDGSIIDPQKGY